MIQKIKNLFSKKFVMEYLCDSTGGPVYDNKMRQKYTEIRQAIKNKKIRVTIEVIKNDQP